jgi:alkanesulfonate monooxygenase SsuD/methylene tetrahydromethanopterin reductase-like flavin-dependent oxidoreductase (luciferase family)
VAKQLAELDMLSGGRAMLGVGIGWNDVEFEALNENFHNRGRRIEEQIEVLRLLWTQEVVDFQRGVAPHRSGGHQSPADPAADPDLDG